MPKCTKITAFKKKPICKWWQWQLPDPAEVKLPPTCWRPPHYRASKQARISRSLRNSSNVIHNCGGCRVFAARLFVCNCFLRCERALKLSKPWVAWLGFRFPSVPPIPSQPASLRLFLLPGNFTSFHKQLLAGQPCPFCSGLLERGPCISWLGISSG